MFAEHGRFEQRAWWPGWGVEAREILECSFARGWAFFESASLKATLRDRWLTILICRDDCCQRDIAVVWGADCAQCSGRLSGGGHSSWLCVTIAAYWSNGNEGREELCYGTWETGVVFEYRL